MFCPKCGAELSNDAEFCMKCGTKLSSASAVQQTNAAQADASTKAKKKKSKLPVILGAAILLIVVVIVIASSLGGSSGSNIDYIATAKAHTPFATSQNLPYTYAEVFDKYTNNLVWETASEDKKTDTATVKADGILKGTNYRLIVSIKVSPNPNNSNSCLIQPQSVNFNGIASTDQNCAVDFLYIMFAAYGEGFEDLSEVLSDLDAVSALLTGSGISGQQINTELSETYANTDMGISFRYPSDWTLFEEAEGSVSITKLVTDNSSGFAANFGVYDFTEAYESGALGIDVFTDDVSALEEAYNQQGNTTVLSIEDVTINGIPARVLKYQAGGLNGTDPVITRDYYINMGRVYRIVCSCNKSIADAYDEVYDAILGSFTITLTEDPAPTPSQSVDPSEAPQTEPPVESSAPEPSANQSGNNKYADYNLYVFAGSYSNESIGIDLTVQPNETEFFCELYWYYGRMVEVGVVCPGIPTQLSEGTTITIDLETNGSIHVVLQGYGSDPFNYVFDLWQ